MVGIPILVISVILLIIGVGGLILKPNPYKELGEQLLREDFNVTTEDAENMTDISLDYLSDMFGVTKPKFQIGKLSKIDGQSPMAIYACDHQTIFIDLEFQLATKTTIYEFFFTICHEFQHYLDHIEIGSASEWTNEYETNKEYYELKSDTFAEKETNRLIKHFVKVCEENEKV